MTRERGIKIHDSPEYDDVISVRPLFVALLKVRGRKEEDGKKRKDRERTGNISLKRLIEASAYIEMKRRRKMMGGR